MQIFLEKIHILGHIVSNQGVEKDSEKVAAVSKMKNSKNNKRIESNIRTSWFLQKIHTRFWKNSRAAL